MRSTGTEGKGNLWRYGWMLPQKRRHQKERWLRGEQVKMAERRDRQSRVRKLKEEYQGSCNTFINYLLIFYLCLHLCSVSIHQQFCRFKFATRHTYYILFIFCVTLQSPGTIFSWQTYSFQQNLDAILHPIHSFYLRSLNALYAWILHFLAPHRRF